MDTCSCDGFEVFIALDAARSLKFNVGITAKITSRPQFIYAEIVQHYPVRIRRDGFVKFVQLFNFYLYSGSWLDTSSSTYGGRD